jgi:adenylate cyclase
MRITYSYHGTQKDWESSATEVILGRSDEKSPFFFDLSPDQKVSRLQCRIWEENGRFWIDDLHSSRGTKLNGTEIKGLTKQQLASGDEIVVGETQLLVKALNAQESTQTNYLEQGRVLPVEKRPAESDVAIAHDVDASVMVAVPVEGAREETARRLRILCDLPLQLGAKTQLESLLPAVLDHVVALIPGGESWALVLLDPCSNALLLKAYHHDRQPFLSETLARRAIKERKAFIWKRNIEGDISGSIIENAIGSGMYAPLVWQGEALGVICAAVRSTHQTFTDEDLRVLVFVAQYAAMAVASHRLGEQLRRESVAKANLLRQFSPKVAEELLSHRGRLRLGGQRSEVTILCSDIRGFTNLAHQMDPDDVVQLLNDYFGVLVPVIFSHGGTIDKFVGDGILAVFGSPEPDPKQHEQAVRAAVEMQSAVAKLNEVRKLREVPCVTFGVGIHCGEVVHGFVGTADRMEFTVISDAVNLTARYCAAAGCGEILISPEMHERVWQIVASVRKTIETKHEGDLVVYCVTCCKKANAKSGQTQGTHQ